jgi:hypothetical protein
MKELIGKKVNALLVNSDQSILVFDTDGGDVVYRTDGDCCSETWFADITGVQALVGGTVADAEEVEMAAVEDGRTRQEYDQFYGVKIKTDKGYADIVYRNSSNGYYGGSIDHVSMDRPDDMTAITDDWSA